jgi:hypothetical protein
LFDQLPEGVVSVAVMEEQLFFNQYAFHKQKLVFHRATMRCYADRLQKRGYSVRYFGCDNGLVDIGEYVKILLEEGVSEFQLYRPEDDWLEHDTEGDFVRRWLPEIAGLPNHLIHQPWTMTEMERVLYGVTLGEDYPMPVVALQGRKIAMVSRIYEMRKSEFAKEEKARVLTKHSRPAKAKAPKAPKSPKAPKTSVTPKSPIEKKKGRGKKS